MSHKTSQFTQATFQMLNRHIAKADSTDLEYMNTYEAIRKRQTDQRKHEKKA